MEESALEQVVSGIVPDLEMQEVVVQFNTEKGALLDYVNAVLCNINMSTNMPPIDAREFVEYCRFLICCRIIIASGKKVPFYNKETQWTIPASISVLLANIGRVESRTYGVVLKPGLSDEDQAWWDQTFPKPFLYAVDESGEIISDNSKKIESREENDERVAKKVENLTQLSYLQKQFRFSNKLRSQLLAASIQFADFIPNAWEGSHDFMTFRTVGQTIRNVDSRPHAVYAMLAAFCEMKQVGDVLSATVNYGQMEQFRYAINNLPSIERSGSGKKSSESNNKFSSSRRDRKHRDRRDGGKSKGQALEELSRPEQGIPE